MKASGLVVIVLNATLIASGCGMQESTEVEEKLMAPKGGVEASLTLTMGGGAAGWVYQTVYLQDLANRKKPQEILRVRHSDRPKLTWLGENRLRIDLPCGSIDHFTNSFWIIGTNSSDAQEIGIVLVTDGPCKR